MANEVDVKRPSFSDALTAELNEAKDSLPANFNVQRFVHNSIALLNGNETLVKFNKQYGSSQIKAGLIRAAYLGLDALNSECYLVPYGSTINFVTSYKGMIKMVKKYSQDGVKRVFADIIREGDEITATIADGKKGLAIKQNLLSKNPVIGCLAQVIYSDGDLDYEYMSLDDLQKVRNLSKAKNSLAWSTFTEEMYKKACIRRLLKRVTLDLDANIAKELDSGIDIETDQKILRDREVQENENSEDFIEVESEVVSG